MTVVTLSAFAVMLSAIVAQATLLSRAIDRLTTQVNQMETRFDARLERMEDVLHEHGTQIAGLSARLDTLERERH